MDLLKLKNNKSGYTLLEILLSFAIFSILFGIMIFGFSDAKNIERFKKATSLFVSHIKEMQNNALTGQEIIQSGTGDKIVPIGGYGLHMDLNGNGKTYILFADTNSINGFTCVDTIGNQRFDNDGYDWDCNAETSLEFIEFGDENIKITTIVIDETDFLNFKAGKDDLYHDEIKANEVDFDLAFQNFKPFPYVGLHTLMNYRDPNHDDYDSEKFNTMEFYFLQESLGTCRKVTVFGSSGMVQEESTPCL